MNHKKLAAWPLWAATFAAGALNLPAQSTSTPDTPSAAESQDEDTVVLSPFLIQASDEPESYRAQATLAGTRIRTDLRDVGSAIQVVTQKFLQDTGSTSAQDLLVYTTNTEVGGQSGNFVGAGNGPTIDTGSQRTAPQTNTRVRGLAAADTTRDFFLTDIPWDSYNIGRVDLQRGPNSILFGIGSPAGIVNGSVNTASFKDSNSIELRYGSFGSARQSVDLNKVLLRNELAIRLSALNDEQKYKQDPAFQHDKRVFGALRYEPSFLKKNGNSTSLRVNFEKGDVVANRPRIIPPIDAVTPWFTAMGKRTYDARNMGRTTPEEIAADPTAGAVFKLMSTGAANPNFQPWLNGGAGGQIFDQPVAAFGSEGNGSHFFFLPSQNTTGIPEGISIPWSVYRGIQTYSDYARESELPNYELGVYKAKTLADPGIFDFYNKLIDGPNKEEIQDFDTINVAVAQTFLNNKLGFEAVYDRQNYQEEANRLINNPYLTVDVINTLPDGRPNPNVGRAMIIGAPNSNSGRSTDREAVRLTAFGELNFEDIIDRSLLGRILGRHVFTGLYSDQSRDELALSWYSYVTDRQYRSDARTLDSRRIPSVSYLGGSLSGLSSANQANIPNLDAVQVPQNGTIRRFNVNPKAGVTTPTTVDDLIGWEDIPFRVLNGYHGADRNSLYKGNGVSKVRDEIASQAFVWQGFFWDGTLVPTVGWRKDVAKNYNAGTPAWNPDEESAIIDDPLWTLPSGFDDPRIGKNKVTYNKETGESLSWSLVLHTPKMWRDRLPLGTNISLFYNRSDNFQPAGGRTDVLGGSIASPTGKTKDYGITISTLRDKLIFKINWYETSVTNASLDGGGTGSLQNVYRVGSNEAWGYMFAKWAQGNIRDYNGGNNYARVDPADPASALIDPNISVLAYQPAPGQSVAEALAAQNAAINAITDPANLPGPAFDAAWGITNRATWDPSAGWAGGGLNWSQPSTLAVTGDTYSEGVEYELTAQPLPSWNITVNASKTSATRRNLAESFAKWVDSRHEFYKGPAGDVRLWNGAYGSQTLRSVWTSEFYAGYLLYRLQENADVPELRPWRFNVISNYDFRSGPLKGVNVGGAYRWQDRNVVGYPVQNGEFVLSDPYMGPTENTIDLWVGYQRQITSKLTWRIQLNVRNLFADKDLIPITVQPDGSPGTSRIPEPRVITLTNTFRF